MKDWRAMTLFRRLGAFAARAVLAIAVGVITPASAWASGYRALVAGQCPSTQVVPPNFLLAPAPVVASAGNATTGGTVRAGAELTGEVHAGVPATNAFNFDFAGPCSIGADAVLDDVVIQGPPGLVHVKLHLPLHANIYQDFTAMTDGQNEIHSAAIAHLFFFAQLGGARTSVDIQWNRRSPETNQISVVPAQFPFGASEFIPKPRLPDLPRVDADGFITQFFQRISPVTGQVGVPFAGFNSYTIDELRGEFILTTDVQANTPLTLFLNVTHNVTAQSFFITSARSVVGEAAFGLASDGSPAFEVPEGYTAQVPSAGVINNVVPQVFKCTETLASWRAHPGDWPLDFMTLGAHTYNRDELFGILQLQSTALRPDASVTLAQQLIAARLNEANGAAPGPMLQPSMAADTLLAGFGGTLPYRVNPTTATGQQMMNIGIALNNYNAGRLGLQCVP